MIPEPSDALGLWTRVKAISGWPQTDETQVQALADGWTAAGRHFDEPARFDTSPGTTAWPDDAGITFANSTGTAVAEAATAAADIAQLAQAASSFAALVTGVKQGITDLIAVNTPIYASLSLLPPVVRGPFELAFVAQVGAYAKILMATAATQAATLGAVSTSTAPGAPGGAPADALPPVPPNGTPQQNANWWKGLREDQKARYVREHPEQIGHLNGLPAVVRDDANRTLLDRERRRLLDERAALEAAIQSTPPRFPQDFLDPQSDAEARIVEIDKSLAGLKVIQERLGSAGQGQPDSYYLLGLDASGQGRFIVSRGNPDTAANVATFVPGAESDLRSAKRALERADGLYAAAGRAGSPSTAVITWMDYDSPDWAATAPLNSDSSNEAAPRLNNFLAGLRGSYNGPVPSHNTVLGHSYGAKVAAQAVTHPGRPLVDEIVGAGTFDMGGGTAADLNVAGDVWVIEHENDAAADINEWNDPSAPGFGARVYDSRPGPYSDTYAGPEYLLFDEPAHGDYYDDKPEHRAGLDRMGNIIADKPVS